ncbi:MAG: rod shape-determining protein RodA [Acidimicrobiia bacterium]|nr:rod shape-determining protein RodA [Acidimicrobiia bacterium]
MALTTRSRRSMRASAYAKPRGRRSIVDAELLGRVDWVLFAAVAALAAIGFVMIYSSSNAKILDDPFYFVKRQALALIIGIGVIVGLLRIDYRKLRDFSMLFYVITCALLFFVITPFGSSAKGAQAWIQLPFGFQLQPSEIAKFTLIVALAGYVNEHRGDIDPWRLTVIIGVALVPLGLVQLQPDLGTNMVLLCIVIGLLAVAGVRGRYLLVLALLAITGIYAVINLGILKQYQVDRLTVVIDSGDKKEGVAYNQDQSVKTIATGSVAGKGLFNGPQTRLGFVPEQQTDFIFTAAGEELGFIGACLILALFGVVLWRTWRTARLARDFYGTLVCAGVLAMFTFMIFENMGMTMGIMPVTGIPLPFMSYGGSALITCLACVGVVQNIYANRFN